MNLHGIWLKQCFHIQLKVLLLRYMNHPDSSLPSISRKSLSCRGVTLFVLRFVSFPISLAAAAAQRGRNFFCTTFCSEFVRRPSLPAPACLLCRRSGCFDPPPSLPPATSLKPFPPYMRIAVHHGALACAFRCELRLSISLSFLRAKT